MSEYSFNHVEKKPSDIMLHIKNLFVHYGKVIALRGVDLELYKGEIVTLIGANGAGKSTLMMSICGDPRPSSGEIFYKETPLLHQPSYKIMRRGIAHAPEGRRIFAKMSIYENLQLGAMQSPDYSLQHFKQDLEKMFVLFPRLKERQEQRGGTLSGGEQQMLAIARALMSRPELLLLDEPSLGLAPLIVKQIFESIEHLNREEGLTIFLVEQNAYHALHLAHRAYLMVNGKITLSGTGQELLNNKDIQAAYLEGAH